MLRSTALLAALVGFASFGAPEASAQTPLTTELFVSGLASPTALTYAPGDATRVFITQRNGRVRVVENGTLLTTPFVNISSIVASGGERGLLGIAFHPDYQNNGRFFLNYTNNAGNTEVSEFAVTADPNVASATIVQTITTVNQDFSNHNGGCIQFGPDGMLYVGMGDGGSANDPNNRAQNPLHKLGKMLRYDVDLPAPHIPADNPFVGNSGVLDDIWHLGLRNPWRFSFDRDTGDMWIADVGQGQREEVDFVPAGQGGLNFGWRCLEGTRCTGLSGCACTDATLVAPIQEYNHSQGCSITGGFVYRGAAIPDLSGTYFYADYCTNRIWSLEYDGSAVQNFTVRTSELAPASGSINSISSFGEDHDGEMYIVSLSGSIWKIIADAPPCGATNYCTANPAASGLTATIGAAGSFEVSQNSFQLFASGVSTGTFGIFFYGPAQTMAASGQGNLCVTGDNSAPLSRINDIVQADIFNSVFLPLDLTAPQFATGANAIVGGSTWNFQFWFRDTDAGGQASWNYSDATSVLFCP